MEVVPSELSGHVGDLTVLTLTQRRYFIRRVTARKFKREGEGKRERESISHPLPPPLRYNALFVFHSLFGLASAELTILNSVSSFRAGKLIHL